MAYQKGNETLVSIVDEDSSNDEDMSCCICERYLGQARSEMVVINVSSRTTSYVYLQEQS